MLGMNPRPYCSPFHMYSITLEATKKFTDPIRYVVYTHPGLSGSNRPAHAARKNKHPPDRLFQLSQNGSVFHRPFSAHSRMSRHRLCRTSAYAPAMKNALPISAAPHAISRFIHGGSPANIARGSMHEMLNTAAPMK